MEKVSFFNQYSAKTIAFAFNKYVRCAMSKFSIHGIFNKFDLTLFLFFFSERQSQCFE